MTSRSSQRTSIAGAAETSSTYLGKWTTGFPDYRLEAGPIIAEGTRVAYSWVFRGTNTGPLKDRTPASSHRRARRSRSRCCGTAVWDGDKLKEMYMVWDQLADDAATGPDLTRRSERRGRVATGLRAGAHGNRVTAADQVGDSPLDDRAPEEVGVGLRPEPGGVLEHEAAEVVWSIRPVLDQLVGLGQHLGHVGHVEVADVGAEDGLQLACRTELRRGSNAQAFVGSSASQPKKNVSTNSRRMSSASSMAAGRELVEVGDAADERRRPRPRPRPLAAA